MLRERAQPEETKPETDKHASRPTSTIAAAIHRR